MNIDVEFVWVRCNHCKTEGSLNEWVLLDSDAMYCPQCEKSSSVTLISSSRTNKKKYRVIDANGHHVKVQLNPERNFFVWARNDGNYKKGDMVRELVKVDHTHVAQ